MAWVLEPTWSMTVGKSRLFNVHHSVYRQLSFTALDKYMTNF